MALPWVTGRKRNQPLHPHGVRGLKRDWRTGRLVHIPYADPLHPRVLYGFSGSTPSNGLFEDNPPTGTIPGTVFTTAHTYAIIQVRYGNVWMRRVASSPSGDEFTYVGNTITMGQTVNSGEDFYAFGSV